MNQTIEENVHMGDVCLTQMQLLNDTYRELINFAKATPHTGCIVPLEHNELLARALTFFGPQLTPETCKVPLDQLFDVAIHTSTGAIIIASKASTFTAKTVVYSQTFMTNFQSFSVYMPGLGIEVAQVGRIGDVCNRPYVLRSESACTPSFLFGSQQCNCASQWRCTQELAAFFNSEKEVGNATIGFLMVHLESQNGMGMGYSPNSFAIDLGNRAQLRHAAGLALSQKFKLSIQETFEAMGLPPDPRRATDGAGYKITPILLDFLGAYSDHILLSNNHMKIQGLQQFGYSPQRIKTLGEIAEEGSIEAKQRALNFEHLDIGTELVSFANEFERLKIQIQSTYKKEYLC
jgi:hypothetical protein